MVLPALWQSSFDYRISTDVFEGPLDLLLQLIENAELDITKLSLAKVTDQYLRYIQGLSDQDPVEVSAFLVIAAKLVFIKSSILLPSAQETDNGYQEDVGDQLTRQLIEYKKFKNIAEWLYDRQKKGLRSYFRVTSPPIIIEHIDLANLSVYDLVDILMDAYFSHEYDTPLSEVVTISALTIKNRITEIKNILRNQSTVKFTALIDKNSRMDVVITFLSLLELIKNHAIQAFQENIFSDIVFEKTQNFNRKFDLEL